MQKERSLPVRERILAGGLTCRCWGCDPKAAFLSQIQCAEPEFLADLVVGGLEAVRAVQGRLKVQQDELPASVFPQKLSAWMICNAFDDPFDIAQALSRFAVHLDCPLIEALINEVRETDFYGSLAANRLAHHRANVRDPDLIARPRLWRRRKRRGGGPRLFDAFDG